MIDDDLRRQAEAAGIEPSWRDAFGVDRDVTPDVLRTVLAALRATDEPRPRPPLMTATVGQYIDVGVSGRYQVQMEDGQTSEGTLNEGDWLLPIDKPGYHTLIAGDIRTTLAVAPSRCFGAADALPNQRAWGLTVQLYALRRDGDAGLGDFRALSTLGAQAGARGASAIAISPVHAQFSADTHRFSPYAPSSRVALNVLHADATGLLPDLDAGFALGAHLETQALVDWPASATLRLQVLRAVHAQFKTEAPEAARAAYEAFRAAGGMALANHARFEALHAYHYSTDPAKWHWRTWPPTLRLPEDDAVAAFAGAHADTVDFHTFLQFLAHRGMAAAQAACEQAGMGIGLISDLAVGTDSGGSDAWSRQTEMLIGLSIGAPPDIFNTAGQNWGITTFSPQGMATHGFGAFLDMLRSAMRHAGGVRIDHVMGLARLWVVPDGADAREGAYLRFPLTDLLRLVALESWRNRAIVLGEDLGTVPHGYRETLSGAGIMGMRVLWFERDAHHFFPPRHWSRDAVGMTTTHDLPTVAGWWQGNDIAWRQRLGQYTDGGDIDRWDRGVDRDRLWGAMHESGAASGPTPPPEDAAAITEAAAAHVGAAACDLVLLPIEDVLALPEQPNFPGTIDEHPNWRRRLPQPVETLLDDPGAASRLAVLADARNR